MATCIVSGQLLNPSEVAISGATLRFNIGTPALDNGGPALLAPKEVTTTTAADGTWSLTLAQGCSGTLTIECPPDSINQAVRYQFSLQIPATSTATFASAWVENINSAGSTSNLSFLALIGQLLTSQFPGLSGDVTVPSASLTSAISKIQGTTVSGTTGTGNVVFSTSPTVTGVLTLDNGAASVPSVVFAASATSGLFRDAGSVGWSNLGVQSGSLSSGGVQLIGGNGIFNRVSTSNIYASGDTGTGSGGEIRLYGANHATKPNNIEFYHGGTLSGSFDNSGNFTASVSISGPGSGITSLNASNLTSGTVPATQMPALTSDVTSAAGAVATTVAKIQGTTVSGTTGTGNVVFAASPTLSGTVAGSFTCSGNITFSATGSGIAVSNNATFSGQVGILRSTVSTASALVLSGTAPSGMSSSTQTGVSSAITYNSSATGAINAFSAAVTSGAAVTTARNYFSNAPTNTGGAITNFIDFLAGGASSHVGATANAALSDTSTPGGNYFVYQSGTDPSVFGGTVTAAAVKFNTSGNEKGATNQTITWGTSTGPTGVTLGSTTPAKWLAVTLSDGNVYYMPLFK